MIKKFSFAAILLLNTLQSIGQIANPTVGARSAGMSGASLTLSDGWSMFNNIGALGSIEQSHCFLSYKRPFGLSVFQTLAAGYVHHSEKYNLGAAILKFGDPFYNEQQIRIGIGNKIQRFSLAGSLIVNQFHVDTQPNKHYVLFDLGGLADLTPTLLLGMSISNANTLWYREVTTSIPMILKLGLSYYPITDLKLNGEIEQATLTDHLFKFGLEYEVVKQLLFRTGFNTQLQSFSVGLGLLIQNFSLDYAFTEQPSLGSIHEFSISFR